MKKIFLLLLATRAFAGDVVPMLEIDLSAKPKPVSPILYGLMTEEINYSYDGGLYAELIRNRAFLDPSKSQEIPNWSLDLKAGAQGAIRVVDTTPLTDKLPNSLEVEIQNAGSDKPLRVLNNGYWGIPIKPDTTYRVSFYVRGNPAKWNKDLKKNDVEPFSGSLDVSLENADGSVVYAKATSPAVNKQWQKMELTLKTGPDVKPTTDGRFVISVKDPGKIWLSLVSLFPPTYKDRPNGFRIDLMEKMLAMKPKFLRFPGGNYLQGDRLWERFDWKATLGPLPFRSGHQGCWNYRSTDGMGLMEFMTWCEDLGAEPVLGLYAGYSLKQQYVQPGPLLEYYVQDALDEIEFLTGDAKTSYWGALRAKYGHPEPYKLRYVEIGNEDWFDKSGSYDARYTQFHDAIKAKYPDLQIIATCRNIKSPTPDLVDDHFYKKSEWNFKNLDYYDKEPRGEGHPKVFVGEWATVESSLTVKDDSIPPTPNFGAALSDAAWMTGMERNSDVVVMHCYAPLFVNVNPGGRQWSTNLIGYNNLESYGSPSYYAWNLFANHVGDVTPPSKLQTAENVQLPHSVTRDSATGKTFVKIVNPSDKPQTVRIKLTGATEVGKTGKIETLSASSPNDTNSITEPTKVTPVTSPLQIPGSSFDHTFPAYSINVLELTANAKP